MAEEIESPRPRLFGTVHLPPLSILAFRAEAPLPKPSSPR